MKLSSQLSALSLSSQLSRGREREGALEVEGGVGGDDGELAQVFEDAGAVRGPRALDGDGELGAVPLVGVGKLLLAVDVGLVFVDVDI